MSTNPINSNEQDNDNFGVIDAGDLPVADDFDPITDEEREEYERAVDHILENDRDGDGDVDWKDTLMDKLSELDDKLQNRALEGDIAGKVAGKLSEIVDKIDGDSN